MNKKLWVLWSLFTTAFVAVDIACGFFWFSLLDRRDISSPFIFVLGFTIIIGIMLTGYRQFQWARALWKR